MEAQQYLQKILLTKMDALKAKNSQFSLRAFARLLDIRPSSLSEFLNGKRKFSPKMMRKVAEKLCLDPSDWTELSEMIVRDYKRVDHDPVVDKEKLKITTDQYYLVADWHYYAILCLAETKEFKNDYAWIAERIGSTETKVKRAMERLVRLGFFTKTRSGKLEVKEVELLTTEDIPNLSLKKRHEQNLEAAKASLYEDDVLVRDFSFGTIAIDPSKLPEAKKMIREFQDKLFDFLQDGEQTEVYEICTQMFPRTNINKEKFYEKFN